MSFPTSPGALDILISINLRKYRKFGIYILLPAQGILIFMAIKKMAFFRNFDILRILGIGDLDRIKKALGW
jgi:hypothetical protein